MNKFWALIINSDMSFSRIWMGNNSVLSFLVENPTSKVYRISNDQVAKIVDNQILWEDVPTTELKEN